MVKERRGEESELYLPVGSLRLELPLRRSRVLGGLETGVFLAGKGRGKSSLEEKQQKRGKYRIYRGSTTNTPTPRTERNAASHQ